MNILNLGEKYQNLGVHHDQKMKNSPNATLLFLPLKFFELTRETLGARQSRFAFKQVHAIFHGSKFGQKLDKKKENCLNYSGWDHLIWRSTTIEKWKMSHNATLAFLPLKFLELTREISGARQSRFESPEYSEWKINLLFLHFSQQFIYHKSFRQK